MRDICAKFFCADQRRPSPLDVGHPVAGIGHQIASALGQVDQLGAAVGRIGPPGQVTHVGEVVDQLRRRGQAQLRSVGQLGEPNAAHPDVAEDLEVRLAHVPVAGVSAWGGEVVAKLPQQPDQQLPDGLTVRRQIS